MSLTWAGSAPDALPPLGAQEVARLAARAAAIATVTALCLLLYSGLLGAEIVGRRLGARARSGRGSGMVVSLWARAALPLVGLRLEQLGRPMTGEGAVVANHASWLDVVALIGAGPVFLVSKAEVRGWPVIGAIGRAIGTVFIDRRPAEAKRQGALIEARLLRGDRIAFFPEGTSTDGMRVLRFRSSLFEALFRPGPGQELRVQPVTIVYRPPDGLPDTFYGWWGGAELGRSLCDVLARSRGGAVTLVFHRPLRAADFPSRKALASEAERIVRNELEARLAAARRSGVEACAGAT